MRTLAFILSVAVLSLVANSYRPTYTTTKYPCFSWQSKKVFLPGPYEGRCGTHGQLTRFFSILLRVSRCTYHAKTVFQIVKGYPHNHSHDCSGVSGSPVNLDLTVSRLGATGRYQLTLLCDSRFTCNISIPRCNICSRAPWYGWYRPLSAGLIQPKSHRNYNLRVRCLRCDGNHVAKTECITYLGTNAVRPSWTSWTEDGPCRRRNSTLVPCRHGVETGEQRLVRYCKHTSSAPNATLSPAFCGLQNSTTTVRNCSLKCGRRHTGIALRATRAHVWVIASILLLLLVGLIACGIVFKSKFSKYISRSQTHQDRVEYSGASDSVHAETPRSPRKIILEPHYALVSDNTALLGSGKQDTYSSTYSFATDPTDELDLSDASPCSTDSEDEIVAKNQRRGIRKTLRTAAQRTLRKAKNVQDVYAKVKKTPASSKRANQQD